MKINHKILSLPPYISTTWTNIKLLAVDGPNLVIILQNENKVVIPNIDKNTLKIIFDAHAKSLEEKNSKNKLDLNFGFPMQDGSGMPINLENLPQAMQHNQEQANMPDLPKEMLAKIADLSKVIGINDTATLPKPEPHCNCLYCQLAKALRSSTSLNEITDEKDEKVSDDDLKFRTFDIEQSSENHYTVTNPFDKTEKYTVFLGNPIGCTCGSDKCEHIQAVLKS